MKSYITKNRKELEQVIWKIEEIGMSQLNKREKFDNVLDQATQEYIYSTEASFRNNKHFEELPPKLRIKLIYATQ